uniref:Translocon-associated protein beta n=1 Tax=Tetraselmis sp. GSL018 TaxID=582737 RepID=A0A061QR03_9CHLO
MLHLPLLTLWSKGNTPLPAFTCLMRRASNPHHCPILKRDLPTHSAAWKIKLQEVALPAEISVVSGSTSHEIERINAGDSATWEYTLVANSAGHFVAPSCRVTYQAESDADSVQETLSTTFSMPILSPSQKNIKMALSMGSYASLGTLNSVTDWRNAGITLLTFGSLVGTRVAYSRISQAAKDRRRRRAIEELQGKSD